MNIMTSTQLNEANESLLNEFKKTLKSQSFNKFKILSLSVKVNAAPVFETACQETLAELKFNGKLILMGNKDSRSPLSMLPYDIFSQIFNLQINLHDNAYQKLLKYNEKHKSDIAIIRTGRGFESEETRMRRSNYYLGRNG